MVSVAAPRRITSQGASGSPKAAPFSAARPPPSPARARAGNGSARLTFEAFGSDEKANVGCAGWVNTVPPWPEQEEKPPCEPVRIDLDGPSDVGAARKTWQPTSRGLGRPPPAYAESRREKPVPKVRLCSVLAREAMIPASAVALIACIAALTHSHEDCSWSIIIRSIGSAIEDFYDSESVLSWLTLALIVGVLVLGLVCSYVCHKAGTSLEKKKERPSSKQDLSRSTLIRSSIY